MGILALKAWRDVKSMKLRGLGIVVATGFWVAFYGGYYMGGESATYSARKIAHDLDLADLQVFITPSTAGEIPAFDDLPGIQVVQKRLFDTGTVERKDGGMLPVYVIYDAALNEAPVNRVEVLEGVLPGRDEQVENGWQVLVDRTMASVHKFGVGDRVLLTLHGVEEEARITGIALTAEFLYPSVDPSILMPAAGSLGILFSPMERIEALFGYPLYNNLSFRFAPLAAKPEIKERILERLTGSGIDIEAVIPREESPDHKIIEGFYRNGYEFGPIFMTLIGLGVFVIFGIYVYRMVEDRRTDIGILLALGSGRLPVAGYVAGVVFSFVLMGCLAGYPLSFLLSRVLAVSFAKPLNLPHHSFVFLPALPLKGTAICLLVCLAVVGIVCLRLWRLTPQEALRGGLPGL